MKGLFKDKPNIDLPAIVERSQQLAQYDPYTVRKKTFKGLLTSGSDIVRGIILKEPGIAFNGISTALSQFRLDDETQQSAKDALLNKGISGREFDTINENAHIIKEKNQDNDLMEDEQQIEKS